jgi:hypothetical protein
LRVVSYSMDLVELHYFGVFRFVIELPEHLLHLIESVFLLYFVPLILGTIFVVFACASYAAVVSWMFFMTADTFDVIICNFPGTLIS